MTFKEVQVGKDQEKAQPEKDSNISDLYEIRRFIYQVTVL